MPPYKWTIQISFYIEQRQLFSRDSQTLSIVCRDCGNQKANIFLFWPKPHTAESGVLQGTPSHEICQNVWEHWSQPGFSMEQHFIPIATSSLYVNCFGTTLSLGFASGRGNDIKLSLGFVP